MYVDVGNGSARVTNLEMRKKQWRYIMDNRKSVLTLEPNEHDNPDVWMLNRDSPHYADDVYIHQHTISRPYYL
jgi:hypothetical protein